ncbi:unnamed protein product, partial [marine sediment metagenome]
VNGLNPQYNDKNIDPSCGCGAFLIGLSEYYVSKFRKPIPILLRENIFGVDILSYNVRRTKILLTLFGLLNNQIIREEDLNIVQVDSLKSNWVKLFKNNLSGKFNNVLGNPPYVKYQDLPDEMRIDLLERWKTIKKGNFNLYFAFFELGYNLLSNEGKLGYITPNNYFTSLAGISLRDYFHTKKCVTEIIDFNHKKVFDVLSYTAITFINRKRNFVILYDRIEENQNPKDFLKGLRTTKGNQEKINLIRSKKLIKIVHEVIKTDLISKGIDKSRIKPRLGSSK